PAGGWCGLAERGGRPPCRPLGGLIGGPRASKRASSVETRPREYSQYPTAAMTRHEPDRPADEHQPAPGPSRCGGRRPGTVGGNVVGLRANDGHSLLASRPHAIRVRRALPPILGGRCPALSARDCLTRPGEENARAPR